MGGPYQNVDVGAGRQRRGDVAEVDVAVDLGRVGLAAAGGADAALVVGLADLVDDDGEGAADLGGELRGADLGGLFPDALIALFLDLLVHRIGEIGRAHV